MKSIHLFKSLIPYKVKVWLRNKFNITHGNVSYNFSFDFEKDVNLEILKKKMNIYFLMHPFKKMKYINEIKYINGSAQIDKPESFVFPYNFINNYNVDKINVCKDFTNGLFYVFHNEKKLYYSRNYNSEDKVKLSYYYISIEQDFKSPHRYLTKEFNVSNDDVVLDIGAAEGNFSLDIVEDAKEVYIFETDSKWIEALTATFEPWKEKVKIINKYVSNKDDENCITLDGLFLDKQVDFIKIDVEGAEMAVLEKSKSLFENNHSIKLAICTYHKRNDANIISTELRKYGFNFSFTKGYMLFLYSNLTPPYFRKGLLKAIKK